MDLGLAGKCAVVTGASKGIGLAVATALAGAGVNVLTASRTITPELAALAREPHVVAHSVDLATTQGPGEAVATAVSAFGGVDILVNNVGASCPRPGFLDLSDADWLSTWNLNFLSAVRACRAAIPLMLERGGGCVLNITSLNSRQPHPMVVDYGAAKAALTNLTKALSEEFAGRGVRVNAIAPGFIRTPMWTGSGGFGDHVAGIVGSSSADEVIEKVAPEMLGITVGRFAEADEVSALALFLASDRAAMMTGSEYLIDGGASKTL